MWWETRRGGEREGALGSAERSRVQGVYAPGPGLRQYRQKSPAQLSVSSGPAPQASAQDGTQDWDVEIVMPGAQVGSSEGQRTGVAREGEGLCVCSWDTGTEQG